MKIWLMQQMTMFYDYGIHCPKGLKIFRCRARLIFFFILAFSEKQVSLKK